LWFTCIKVKTEQKERKKTIITGRIKWEIDRADFDEFLSIQTCLLFNTKSFCASDKNIKIKEKFMKKKSAL